MKIIGTILGVLCLAGLPTQAAFWVDTGYEGDLTPFAVTYPNPIASSANTAKLTAKWTDGAGYHDIATVCLDVGIYLKDTDYNLVTSSSPLLGINPKWGNPDNSANAKAALNAAAYVAFKANLSRGADPANYKALQLAVWETLYDTPQALAFNGGRFQASGGDSGILSQAETYLAYARESDIPTMKFTVLKPVADNSQELFYLAVGELTPVPEASTYIAGLGALSLMLGAFWRSRKA